MKTLHLLKSLNTKKLLPRPTKHVGASPGTISYVGRQRHEKVAIDLFDYNSDEITEKRLSNIDKALAYKEKDSVTWINITGVHDITLIEEVGRKFDLHPLILEDVTNTTQRPKIEDYGDYLFIVLKMAYFDNEQKDIIIEQVSLIFNSDYVITFQEKEADILDPLRERIRGDKGRIRKYGADYLFYGIIDSIIDHYFIILEQVGEELELIEEGLISNPNRETLNRIYKLKRELIFLRKSIWPMREVVSNLQRSGYSLIKKTTGIFLRDVYDHTVQVVETIETFRDMVSGMLDLYLTNVSNRMNEIMKVLTIFASIFIPLTFIVGVYGMNFKYMPELSWKWGYAGIWGVLITVGGGLMLYFKKKKWL